MWLCIELSARFSPRSGRSRRYTPVHAGTRRRRQRLKPPKTLGEAALDGPGRDQPRRARNPKVAGSNLAPATIENPVTAGFSARRCGSRVRSIDIVVAALRAIEVQDSAGGARHYLPASGLRDASSWSSESSIDCAHSGPATRLLRGAQSPPIIEQRSPRVGRRRRSAVPDRRPCLRPQVQRRRVRTRPWS